MSQMGKIITTKQNFAKHFTVQLFDQASTVKNWKIAEAALQRFKFLNFKLISASLGSPRDLTTEEMRKLLERNEVVQGAGGNGLQPFDTVNV